MAKTKTLPPPDDDVPTNPSKPGPKPKLEHSEQLLEQIRALGKIQATVEEAASVLRVSLRTLQNFFTMHEDAKLAHEEGKSEGRASLRRAQFTLAVNGNPTMLIWLGKNMLDQREPVQKTEIGKPGDFDQLNDQELAHIIAEQTRELAEADPEFAASLRMKRATKH